MDETKVVLTRDRAALCAGLSERQVAYWAGHGVVRPTVETRLEGGRLVRLYEYVDLMSLLVAARLREHGVSLQNIRKIVTHLHSRGYEHPLTEFRYATVGNQVYVQHPDGTWESGLQPSQLVIHQVIALEPLRATIREAAQREPDSVGRIERRRGVMGGKPRIGGTRVPVDAVRRHLEFGRTDAEILKSYPQLRPADIDAVRAATATA